MKIDKIEEYNYKKYDDQIIIWDELFSYDYEKEIDAFDANKIHDECHYLIQDMNHEYYEY